MNMDVMGVQEVSPGYEFVAENPAVPVGYKHSASGLIPEEWEALELEQALTLQRGYDLPYRLRKIGNVPIISSSGASGLHDVEKVGPPGVVTGRYGTIGEVFYVKQAYWPLNTTLYVKDFKGNDSRFIYYLLGTVDFVSHSGKSGVPGVNRNDVHKEQIALPPIHEQRAIATALSDVDALLEELDRLITKKRDIKQAAMQQLLTGETRLPGFDGEWESFRLGDHVTFLKTGTNSRAELQSDGNDASVRYLHYGDIHASKASFMDSSALPFLPSEKAATLGRLQNGDLIMSDASEDIEGIGKSVEITNVGTADVVAGLHTIAARFSPDVLADGFKAYLQYCPAFITPLRRLAAGTKVYATTRKHIESIEMQLPGLEEQVAIAHVFKDIDTELQALEQRRSKTAELKQGMMQELLTGRTRLVWATSHLP